MSDYIVSARKYRPDSFENLVGQDNIAKTLKNSILRGQLAHAYLFCGPRGVGKTSTARIFAKMINCSSPKEDMEPCGHCESCRSFAEGRSYCIHELDAASNNGVEDIKALIDQVRVPPQVGKYSVYIIDEVHMLSQAAFNAFLKTLEEPPAHAIFILATTEKHKILPTILSRCQTYDFNRISIENIVGNLRNIAEKENISIDDESLHVIAHKADGAMRDALTIFDQTVAFCGTDIHYQDVIRNLNVLDYEYSFSLTDAFLRGDYAFAMLKFDEILSKGFNALHFVGALSSHFRNLLISRTGGMEALLELPESLKKRYKEQADSCSVKFLYDALGITSQCEAGYRASVNQRLHIEFSLMRLCFINAAPDATCNRPVQPAAPVAASAAPVAQPAAPAASPVETPAPVHPVAAGPIPAQPVAPAPAPAPATSPVAAPATAPVAPAPTAAPVETPAIQHVPVAVSAATTVPTTASAESAPTETAARPKRRNRANGGASLSIKNIVEASQTEPEVDNKEVEDVMPSDEDIRQKWSTDMVKLYAQQPRLASTLESSKLDIVEENGAKKVVFYVQNIAQKQWIEEKRLFDLEGNFRRVLGSTKMYLRVEVVPVEETSTTIYLPSEKAQDLREKNPEVDKLIKQLHMEAK